MNLEHLPTEARNPATARLDQLTTLQMVEAMHAADFQVLSAVENELPRIAHAIDAAADRLDKGGRLYYLGAGTSGRLGVLDASECPPTFNTAPELVQGVIAGGDAAMRSAVEGAEDDSTQGERDLEAHGFCAKDVLVGIAASGRTPYVLGGIAHGNLIGAATVGLSCVPGSLLERTAQLAITPATGAEVVTGSTRMKAGTATKLVLNMLTTGVFVRLGYVYGNLMVNVQPTNVKLRDRAQRIVSAATGIGQEEAAELMATAGSVKAAIAMQRLGIDRAEAESRLAKAHGRLRAVIDGQT